MILFEIIRQYFLANKFNKYSPDQITLHQETEFRKLAKYAALHSPFYKDIVERYNINLETCVIEDFPIITKDDLLDNFESVVTDRTITKNDIEEFLKSSHNPTEKFRNKYYIFHTSGTSGKVGYYIFNEREITAAIRGNMRATKTRFNQRLLYIGAVKSHFGGISAASLARFMPFIYSGFLAIDINDDWQESLEIIQAFNPTTVSGYPFAITKLANSQIKNQIALNPNQVMTGGETTTANDKEIIKQAFGNIPIINMFGTSEFTFLGVGREEWVNGENIEIMSLMDDLCYTEIHDEYCVVTNLFNYSMPLIRYQLKDKLKINSKPVNNGLPFMQVENLVARRDIAPTFINTLGQEDDLSLIIFAAHFHYGIQKIKVIILNKTAFNFEFTLNIGLDIEQKNKAIRLLTLELNSFLHNKKMSNLVYKLIEVSEFKPNKNSGKFNPLEIHDDPLTPQQLITKPKRTYKTRTKKTTLP
jgi:phenylacetate-CoA ligase